MLYREWVPHATRDAMRGILNHAAKVGLSNTDEFTFRAFFMAAAYERLDTPRFQTEWKKFDLLVQTSSNAMLIEFKYYLYRWSYHLNGARGNRKGGAGLKNEVEFYTCLSKLRNPAIDGIDHRRLVLVYQRDDAQTVSRTFHDSYGKLNSTSSIATVWPVSVGPLEARILEPTPGC